MGNEDFIVVVILTQRREQSDNRKNVNFDQITAYSGKNGKSILCYYFESVTGTKRA